ncbi:FG-GAP-like repeat-containing protein [Hymenobacter antarcticus]
MARCRPWSGTLVLLLLLALPGLAPAQTITSFSPLSGPIGTSVTIVGTGFDAGASQNVVFFGATRATVTAASPTSLTVSVPLGATYQYPSVTNLTSARTAYAGQPFVVTLNGAVAFAAEVDFTTGVFPFSVSIGDVDGDGKPDLAVTNFNNNTVSVLRNTSTAGTASFAAKVDFATGANPRSVSIGDVDGDGKPDLAVVNQGDNTVSVLRNTGTVGTASFAAKVDFATGSQPVSVSIGDVDGDGKPDLAVANLSSATVSVLRNTGTVGTASFAAKVDFPTGTSPFSVSIGDVDGDGKPDLAVANLGSNTVSVLRNTGTAGTASFAAKVDFATGIQPFSMSIGDVDGDGKPDLAVANLGSNTVSVLRNTGTVGTASFAAKVDFATGIQPFSMSIGDVDGDGKPDLAVANLSSNTVSVLRNTGTAGTASFAAKVDFTTGSQPRSVSIGDVDGDGKPDLAVANSGSATVSVLRQVGTPPVITSLSPTSGPVGTSVTISGTNLSGATSVSFNGTAQTTIGSNTATSVVMAVPAGATTGNVTVTTPNGTSNGISFAVTVPPPIISSFSPSNGAAGTVVTLTGTNLTGLTGVRFGAGGLSTQVSLLSATSATAVVPLDAATGPIAATTPNGTGSSAGSFAYSYCTAAQAAITPAGPIALPSGGTQVLTATATTPGFNTGGAGFSTGGFDRPRTLAVQADGKVLVGGDSFTYNGSSTNGGLVRLSADGTRDLTFNSGNAGFGSSGIPSIATVLVQSDGKILVAGSFTTYNGTAVPRSLIRLNADGSRDATFNGSNAGFGATGGVEIESIVLQADGKILVAGAYPTSYNGSTVPAGLIRLNADGSRDASFNGSNAGFTGGNGIVRGLALQPDGKVVAVGEFTAYNGGAAGAIVRLNADGSRDATFNTGGNGFNTNAGAVVVQPDGKIVVGSNSTTYNGVAVPRCLIRLNADGSRDATFNGSNQGLDNTVLTLALQPDGKVLAGGFFSTFNFGAVPRLLARFNSDGSLDATFNGGNAGFGGSGVYRVALYPDGKVLAGGFFTTYNGAPTPGNIARLNANGSLNNTAAPLAGATFVFNPGNTSGNTRTVNTSGSYTATATDPASGCTYTSNTVVVTGSSAPTLTSLSPTSGPVSTSVTLTGTNFTGATAVSFNGTSAPGFVVNSPTSITVSVPTGATTGNVTVTTPGGTSNGVTFTVTSPLIIVSTSPTANARAASGPVSVTFDQAVTSASTAALKVFSAQRGGLRTGASGTTTASGSTVSFAPTFAFRPGETVQATVTTAATASAGGSLAAPRVYQFTAGAGAGPGTFSGGSNPAVGTGPESVVVADVDGDGDGDLLTVNYNSSTVSVRLNSGNGTFGGGSDPSVSSGPRTLAVGDVDGDGDIDLLTASLSGTVSVRLNNGSGTFAGGSQATVGSQPRSITLADVDGDGDLDLLTANEGDGTVSIGFNNGGGVFGGFQSVTVGSNASGVAVGDVDGDGDLDLLTANANASGTASIRFNNGSGSFGGGTQVAVGSNPRTIAVADVDGDGDLDLLTANESSSTVSIRLNNGSGAFGGGTDPSVGSGARSVAVGDVDGDGDPDLLTVNYSAGTVSVRLNNGSGSFAGGADLGVGSNPYLATVADLDGDGDLDLLAANQGSNTVSVRFNQNAALPDLVVSTGSTASPTAVAAGAYNSITVTGTGVAQLSGNTTVNTSVTVNGTLLTNCQSLTGAGSFTLVAGGTLGICDPAGIAASGATGAVQTNGSRAFSTDASYLYNGIAAQATGSGLPAQVRNLSTTNSNALTLSAPTSVTQVLTVGGAGNLVLNGRALTLLSSAAGTALAVNASTGVVSGTATVQRYIDPSLNAGAGYRHFSAPVSNTTVADLATAGFAPEVSQATVYNASTTPGTTTPFPTVFGYDQSRVTLTNSYTPFDRGFVVPAALTTPLVVGQGYAVNIPASQLVDFVGSLTNGDQMRTLSRVNGNPDAGWQLVGNPYPAPLDYSLVALADRANLDAAIYVYSSTGQYAGQYRSYANGVGGNPVIPLAQGFFARVSAGQTSGSLTFRNSQRLTTPNATAFQRTTADPRPLVQLDLRGATGPADAFYTYAQAGATPAFDNQFDAEKLANPSGLNLGSTATSGQHLAIDGRPAFDAATVLPLNVGVPAAGTYSLTAADLHNLPAGLDAYLIDAATGQTMNLRLQPGYSFTVTTAQAAATLVGRFSVQFRAGALATGTGLTAAAVTLYPNPAHETFTVQVPAVTGATVVRAELLNILGQVVRYQTAALSAAGALLSVDAVGLAQGVYLLRLQAGATLVTKRVVLQ